MFRALEWLLAAPWRLVLLVALTAGVPTIVVGELSAQDARDRIRLSELRSSADAAARAGDLVFTQLSTVRSQVIGAAANPNLKLATEERDGRVLLLLARDLKSVMSRDVRSLTIVDALDVVLAREPADAGAVGRSLRDVRARVAKPGAYSQAFVSDEGGGPALLISSVIVHSGFAVGSLLAEIDLRFAHDWLAPARTATQDVYVMDERGRILARASQPRTEDDPRLFRDLSTHPLVSATLRGTVSSVESVDPFGGERRILSTAAVGDTAWQVMVARDPDVVEREAGTALFQLQVSRAVLVAVLLIGSYGLALAAGTLLRQRRALAETNRQLARASQAKSRFLASVSHELRTPMNAILGFTDALLSGLDGPLNEEQRASLIWVQRGGQDLLGLINEVLDLSKIEAGKLVVAPELFAPRDLVESVCAQYRSLAAQKGLRLTWRDEGLPETVHLDLRRTRQILVNLCGNALKFTSEGEVEIVGRTHDGRLHITLRDTGSGIPRDQLEAIFQEFRQVEGTTGGTGLGLAISRRLARLMSGDVQVESEVGRGSTFTVSLPVDLSAPSPEVASQTIQPQRTLLFSVDDDPSVAPLLEKMLGDRGYTVVAATSASLAVAEARRLQPSVIALDLLMPERDGSEVMRDLRSDPLTRDIPIIALTVMDKADVPSGADAHLMKPIRKDRLLRTLEQVVPVTIVGR